MGPPPTDPNGCPQGGHGLMFFNAGGSFNVTGGAQALFQPMDTTTSMAFAGTAAYADILLFQSRSNTSTVTISGGSGIQIAGALYVPNALTTLTGGSTGDSMGVGQVITQTLTVSGNAFLGGAFGGSSGGAATYAYGLTS
jgi:hypothetical protein